jgi:hypothetical protein
MAGAGQSHNTICEIQTYRAGMPVQTSVVSLGTASSQVYYTEVTASPPLAPPRIMSSSPEDRDYAHVLCPCHDWQLDAATARLGKQHPTLQ